MGKKEIRALFDRADVAALLNAAASLARAGDRTLAKIATELASAIEWRRCKCHVFAARCESRARALELSC